MHALIIEDERMFAEIIEYVLRTSGFATFDVAVSSGEAISAAHGRSPDLITADVALASGNGIDAIKAICPSMPVIFITGQPGANVRAQMPDYPVLHKPFSEQTLTYLVAASMRRRASDSLPGNRRTLPSLAHARDDLR